MGLANLLLDDVDLDEAVVAIRQAKGGGARLVSLSKAGVRDVDRYILARRQHTHASLRWLWVGSIARLTETDLVRAVAKRCRQIGVEPIGLHRFRHTHQWLVQGGNEGDLMMLAGWTSRAMLSRHGASAAQSKAIEAAHRPRAR